MPTNRYFAHSTLTIGEQIAIEGPECRHIVRVSRTQIGDRIELVNGQGILAAATLLSIEKSHITLEVREIIAKANPPSFELILAQAIPRVNHLDWIIEKGTELGVTEIWLFPGLLSERQALKEHQLQRLQNLAIAAMKQCGCLYLPKILLKPPLNRWQPPSTHSLYFGDLDPTAPPLLSLWQTAPPQHGAFFFIGPESGLSKQEIAHLKKWKSQGVKLHPNILRTETAAIAAICLATHWMICR